MGGLLTGDPQLGTLYKNNVGFLNEANKALKRNMVNHGPANLFNEFPHPYKKGETISGLQFLSNELGAGKRFTVIGPDGKVRSIGNVRGKPNSGVEKLREVLADFESKGFRFVDKKEIHKLIPEPMRTPKENLSISSSHLDDSGDLVVNLSGRQKRHLSQLDQPGASVVIKKSDVNLADLSSMTAATRNEFGVFTRKGERLLVRGYSNDLGLTESKIFELALDGWRFSGHTHPGITRTVLTPSSGDRNVLRLFNEMGTQNKSVIQNSLGEFKTFSSNAFDDMFGF